MPPKTKVKLDQFNSKINLDRGAGKVKEIGWYLIKMLFFLTAFPFPNNWKCFFLRLFGAHIGKGVIIKPRVNIHFPWKLEVGNHVWIGEEVFILNFEPITIGNQVCISQRCFLCGGNHDFRDPTMSYRNGPIALRDGCWIGAGCFVGPGVQIGVDSVVTAGSVVTKSLDPNGVYRGNPAVLLGKRWK